MLVNAGGVAIEPEVAQISVSRGKNVKRVVPRPVSTS